MTVRTGLSAAAHAHIDDTLAATDRSLERDYPGDSGTRQPVHTVYLAADRFETSTAATWGAQALEAVRERGMDHVCDLVGVPEGLRRRISDKVGAKLLAEPVEDLRLDFEDGYGPRGDDEEDLHAAQAAQRVNDAVSSEQGPAFIGIRFKSFEQDTRARGLRTLDVFVSELLAHGGLPEGLVLTLPKVSTTAQVRAMVYACGELERAHGLEPGRLRFEVQMETPQLIIGADGTIPVAELLHRGDGRITALHYGTYDYSASLEIAAAHQSMEHPAADFAKQVMQVAVAGTGVRLSDGSTNVLPLGSDDNTDAAWALHGRLVRRSLERGYYQGWDLHPAQLPSRFAATYLFYLEGFEQAATRLNNYVHGLTSTIMDEPATARALARFIDRGHACGALSSEEVEAHSGVSVTDLKALAHPKKHLMEGVTGA
jgi:citrate lyase beta subunit